jgi:molybdopterin converting factor small subunit
MKVSLKCFANLAKEGVCDYSDSTTHDIPEGARITDLIDKLGYSKEAIKLVYANNLIVPKETLLQDGDRIAFAPATGGM